ncbi:hypothetical protein BZG29_17040 [Janthinobacterium sp. LM6]|nr:hypothetical protein BZG29_17040 [Janthinobacterium sp. LM6]
MGVVVNLIEFKQSADKHIAEVERLGSDIDAILAYVGAEQLEVAGLAEAGKAIRLVALEALSKGRTNAWECCRGLCKELVQRYVIEGEPLYPYIHLAESIRDHCRGGSRSHDGIEGDWSLAVKCSVAGRKIREMQGYHDLVEPTLGAYRNYEEGARAAKRLMAWGFAFERSGGELRFEPESERRILADIDRRVQSFGGLALARRIFGAIAGSYDPAQERHHITRRPTNLGNGTPQEPLGYLLQLAVKHPLGRKPLRNSPQHLNRIVVLATDYAAVMEVQPYWMERFVGRDAVAMFQGLREIAIYDTLFCLPQLRPRDAVAIAEGILDGIEISGYFGSGWSMANALEVSRAIVESSAGKRGPQSIDVDDLLRRCPKMSREAVSRTLREALSHPEPGANQCLLNPLSAELGDELSGPGIDFFDRPLLNLGGGRFELLDRSMCATAFINALLAPAEKFIKDFGSKHAGVGVEKMLRRSFLARGVKTKAGKYSADGETFDCDAVVETSDKVILIEVKKKALTATARAGFDVSVILDLANSVLRAQTQAAQHELRLRRGETLKLTEADGTIHELRLDGRDVERVAVSLPDFGSFQDREVLMGFLHSQMEAEYSVSAPQYKEDFEKLAKLLAKFKKVEAQLHAMQPESVAPFYHCWFLSVPQLLILLDEAHDAESFWRAWSSTRGIHMGTLDFYWEHACFNAMKETALPKTAFTAPIPLRQV